MDNRIINLVSNRLIIKKNEIETELEKLINGGYNISVEETIDRIETNLVKLNSALHNIQMWEGIIVSVTQPQNNNENPEEGDNKQ